MHPLAGERTKAYLQDILRVVGVGVASVPLGVLAYRRGLIGPRERTTHLVSAVLPVIATVWAAREESGPRRATWGKRRRGLTVTTADGRTPGLGRALLRNTVKIAVPWQIGHTVAVGAAYGGFDRRDPVVLASTALVYPLVGTMIGCVAGGSGRALHDRIAGTRVRRSGADPV